MRISLAGRRVLVTGATQGLGEAIAHAVRDCGAGAIAISGRDAARGAIVAAELGPTASFHAADLADPEAPIRLFASAREAMGGIDALVNAAGLTTRGSFLNGTLADWETLFAVNARAPFLLMQALIRDLVAAGRPGSIVNIQSINAHCGAADLAMYSASKGALATLTRNAAAAHLGDRIRVNGINMGWAATAGERKMQAETLGKGPGWEADAAARMPLGRLLQVEEVAALTVYLLSDLSGLQTGTVTDLEQRVLGSNP